MVLHRTFFLVLNDAVWQYVSKKERRNWKLFLCTSRETMHHGFRWLPKQKGIREFEIRTCFCDET
jgi:hypothetical protein